MESCPLPIEVCEFVIDAIVSLHVRRSLTRLPWLAPPGPIRDALTNCALTCRAWRPRAQRRLWDVLRLDAFSVNKFVAKIRHVPARLASLVHTLEIYLEEGDPICRLNELLLASTIPGLHTLELHYRPYGFSRPAGLNLKLIHPKVLRTRPPLLAHVTSLKLSRCCFASLRAMFDVIWACPSLSSLKLEDVQVWNCFGHVTQDAVRILLSTAKHLGGCGKLKELALDFRYSHLKHIRQQRTYIKGGPAANLFPTSDLFIANDASLFGTNVTNLDMKITTRDMRECLPSNINLVPKCGSCSEPRYIDGTGLEYLTNFLPGIFPALTTLRVDILDVGIDFSRPSPSALRLLAERTAAPSKCRRVVLNCVDGHCIVRNRGPGRDCRDCDYLFGKDHNFESMAASEAILRRRFTSLEELCFVIHEGHSEGCAERIQSMLPTPRGLFTISQECLENTGTPLSFTSGLFCAEK